MDASSSRPLRATRAVLAAALLSAAACGGGRARRDARPDLVLVVVDTLRADHLGCYGAERETSPAIDALAAESARFERATSAAPWTMPAVATIMTGLHPRAHRVVRPKSVLPEGAHTLAEILREAGYATAAVTSNALLREGTGFDQGFDRYEQDHARGSRYVSSQGVTEDALALLDALVTSESPFFLSLLYYDPHYSYVHHPEIGFAGESVGKLQGGDPIARMRRLAPTLGEEGTRFVAALYDEEVRFTDEWIGVLLDGLRERGVYDDTVVVVAADHGEELFDRGWLGHTRTLYEELIRVPLLIRAPRVPEAAGRVVDARVTMVSLAPTLLDLCGVDTELGFHGPSLVPLLRGEAPPPGPVYAEVDFVPVLPGHDVKEAHERAVIVEGYKLVVDGETGAVELYDLRADPGERNDLAARELERVARYTTVLEECTADAARGAVAEEVRDVTEEDVELMQDLGYAGGD